MISKIFEKCFLIGDLTVDEWRIIRGETEGGEEYGNADEEQFCGRPFVECGGDGHTANEGQIDRVETSEEVKDSQLPAPDSVPQEESLSAVQGEHDQPAQQMDHGDDLHLQKEVFRLLRPLVHSFQDLNVRFRSRTCDGQRVCVVFSRRDKTPSGGLVFS